MAFLFEPYDAISEWKMEVVSKPKILSKDEASQLIAYSS